MKAPLSYVPALPAAAGLIAGIALGEWGAGVIAAVAGCLAFAALYFMRLHYYAFVGLMVALGSMLYYADRPNVLPLSLQGQSANYAAKILGCAETKTGYAVRAQIDSCNSQPVAPPVQAMLRVVGYGVILEPGQRIDFYSQLVGLPIAEQVPHEKNASQFLRAQGFEAYALLDPGKIKIAGQPSYWQNLANGIRNGVFNAIVDSPIRGETAAFLVAAILGDDIFIGLESKEAFRATGISHILALSGLHVGILASLLAFMLAPLKLSRRGFYLQPLLTALLIWGYAWLVGMGPSVTRAAAMMSVFIAARLLQRDSVPFNSLCIAAIVCLCISPMSLFTPGFQLSFVAVVALLTVMPLIPRSLKRHPALYFIANMLLLPIAAMFGTGLISAYYFHIMPWLFLPANIIAGVIFPCLLTGGLLLLLATALGLQLTWMGWGVDFLYSLLSRISLWAYGLDWSAAKSPYFSNWAFLPYIAAMACLAFAIYRRERRRAVIGWLMGCLGCIALTGACAAWIQPAMPLAEMYMPVRRPAAMLLRYANRAVMLPLCNFNVKARDVSSLEHALADYNMQYSGFLSIRGCGDSFACHYADTLDMGPIMLKNQCVLVGEKLIAVANSNGVPQIKADYALICPEYSGNMAAVVAACHPDTILFASEMAPMRQKKLQCECGDSMPCISLRKSPFSIIIN